MTANLTDLRSLPTRQRMAYYREQAAKLRQMAEAQQDEKISAKLFSLAGSVSGAGDKPRAGIVTLTS
jgi:hypothetical protein